MAAQPPVIAAIHPQHHLGQKVLADWQALTNDLAHHLSGVATPLAASSDTLLLFAFNHPYNAIARIQEILHRLRRDFQWPAAAGPLPIQVALHYREEQDRRRPVAILDPGADLWALLGPETIHLTDSLRRRWEELMAGQQLPAHRLEEAAAGLHRLVVDGGPLTVASLFPCRNLGRQGSRPPCFYCSLTSHAAAACPSRRLPVEPLGLERLGHFPLEKLAKTFTAAFQRQQDLARLLEAGISPQTVRKHNGLQVWVGYLDLLRVYQPRFLWWIAFDPGHRWVVTAPGRLRANDRNLQLALDCLRVGRYHEAEAYAQKIRDRQRGRVFAATVAAALAALEQDRPGDFLHLLDQSRSYALTERQRVYSGLLLGRAHLLAGNLPKAREAVGFAHAAKPGDPDSRYLALQIEAQRGLTTDLAEGLRRLIQEEKEFFLLAMMDPLLLPIHGFVEETQTAMVAEVAGRARRNLAEAEHQCELLGSWLGEEDQRYARLREDLKVLDRQRQRHAYFSLLEVEARAGGITNTARRLIREALEERQAAVEKAVDRYETLQRFWKNFPWKFGFAGAAALLVEARQQLTAARDALRKATAQGYREAGEALETAGHLLDRFTAQQARMLTVQALFRGVGLFGRRLVLVEGLALLLAALLLVAGPHLPLPAPLPHLLARGAIRSRLVVLLCGFAAPLAALALTVRGARRR